MIFRYAFLLFIASEALTLFASFGLLGFITTVFLCLGGIGIGVALIQKEGLGMLSAVQDTLHTRTVLVDDIFNNVCMVIAGLLFITPGFFSDFLAVLLVIPSIRKYLSTHLPGNAAARTTPGTAKEGDIVDATYVRVEETVEQIEQNPPK